MGITIHGGTPTGAVTPTCNDCGVSLCWDIARTEYLEAKPFWEAWRCQDCRGSRDSARGWLLQHGREALPADVEAAIAAFEAANPLLVDARGDGRQDERSTLEIATLFAASLADAGVAAHVAVVADVRGRPHHAVNVGPFSIDWTAARHDEDAPTPLVFRTDHGWPVVPKTISQLLEDLSLSDPDAFETLVAAAIAKKADREAKVAA